MQPAYISCSDGCESLAQRAYTDLVLAVTYALITSDWEKISLGKQAA